MTSPDLPLYEEGKSDFTTAAFVTLPGSFSLRTVEPGVSHRRTASLKKCFLVTCLTQAAGACRKREEARPFPIPDRHCRTCRVRPEKQHQLFTHWWLHRFTSGPRGRQGSRRTVEFSACSWARDVACPPARFSPRQPAQANSLPVMAMARLRTVIVDGSIKSRERSDPHARRKASKIRQCEVS